MQFEKKKRGKIVFRQQYIQLALKKEKADFMM